MKVLMKLVLVIFCWWLLLVLAQPSYAQEVVFSDDFNDGDFSDWQLVRNAQWHDPTQTCLFYDQPAQWEIVDGELGITIDCPYGCVTELVPKNLDLSQLNSFRYEFDWHFKESTKMDRNVLLKWQDKDNWYGLKILHDQIKLEKNINGLQPDLYNHWGYYQFEPDETYHFEIEVVNNVITVLIEDQLIFETIDHFPHLSGNYTIGLKASMGAIVRSASYFDNLKVTALTKPGEKKLGVPLFKQTDPAWKNDEYDQAKKWSNKPTIQRWGCALSSAAMILRHYGISEIPSGDPLNPDELNWWLNSQPDGYVGQGLLNWLAISRLTKKLSSKLKTPILEYSRLSETKLKTAVAKIKQKQPVILQIPGHFMVADGYPASKKDLYIKDPAYKYQLFSQHEKEINGISLFTPSQTDLSYFLFVSQPGLRLSLTDQNQQKIDKTQTHHEHLQALNSELGTETQIYQFTTLAKPAFDTYQLRAVNNSDQPAPLELYFYDTAGQVTTFNKTIAEVEVFEFEYAQDEAVKLKSIDHQFPLFLAWLEKFYYQKQIQTRYVYRHLAYLAQQKNKSELIKKLDTYQKFVKTTAQEKLFQLLQPKNNEP